MTTPVAERALLVGRNEGGSSRVVVVFMTGS
jgi:hypothetical protein